MAEEQEDLKPDEENTEDEVPESKESLVNVLLRPENLKKIIFGGGVVVVLILVIITVMAILSGQRPDDAPYWYKEYEQIKFSSYENKQYGTFYCSTSVHIAYRSSSVEDKLIREASVVKDAIRKVISNENYYNINTNLKRIHNLSPKIVNELNYILSLNEEDGIVDIAYPDFLIVPNKEPGYIRTTYFDLGPYSFNLKDQKKYNMEIYLIYDASSKPFNTLLEKKKSILKKQIYKDLENQISTFSRFIDKNLAKSKIKRTIEETIEVFFIKEIETVLKKQNPLYEEKKLLPLIHFSLFQEIDLKQ